VGGSGWEQGLVGGIAVSGLDEPSLDEFGLDDLDLGEVGLGDSAWPRLGGVPPGWKLLGWMSSCG